MGLRSPPGKPNVLGMSDGSDQTARSYDTAGRVLTDKAASGRASCFFPAFFAAALGAQLTATRAGWNRGPLCSCLSLSLRRPASFSSFDDPPATDLDRKSVV